MNTRKRRLEKKGEGKGELLKQFPYKIVKILKGVSYFFNNILKEYEDLIDNSNVNEFFGEEVDDDFKEKFLRIGQKDLEIFKNIIGNNILSLGREVDIEGNIGMVNTLFTELALITRGNNSIKEYNIDYLIKQNDSIQDIELKTKISERIYYIDKELKKININFENIVNNENLEINEKVDLIETIIEKSFILNSLIGLSILSLLQKKVFYYKNTMFNGVYKKIHNINSFGHSYTIIGFSEEKILKLLREKEDENFFYIDINDIKFDDLIGDRYYIITGADKLSKNETNDIISKLLKERNSNKIRGYTLILEKGKYEEVDMIVKTGFMDDGNIRIIGQKDLEWISKISKNKFYDEIRENQNIKILIDEYSYLEKVRNYINDLLSKNEIKINPIELESFLLECRRTY